jgi:hypothetical protein
MRQRLVGKAWARGRCLPALALGTSVWASVLATSVGVGGCAISESDAHRWETTENGPAKLYAIVAHDKYAWPLREEAALSLIRMRPRNGKRIGLEYAILGYDTPEGKGPGALAVLGDDARRRIVDGIAPKLIEQMQQPPPPPPAPAENAVIQPDPSIAYKDGAFALLSHEPPLASNEATKASLIAALSQWVQTDFENRIDNSAQQFGVEQIMRFIGASSVKTLPSFINETSTKVDRACQLIADIGDDDTKRRASDALVTVGKHIASSDWIEKQRALVVEANQKARITATPQQVGDQLKQYQDQELEKVFTNMKRVGGRPAVDFCLAYAHDKSSSEKSRTNALAALENRVDKSVPADVNIIVDILTDDSNPDSVRAVAMARLGELPKDMILPKLYALFDKKWQVRLDAARMILKTITTKDLPDFMQHLPQSDKAKMALSEPIAYGSLIMAMDPQGGPKPRDALSRYLPAGGPLGAKLTAIGSYFAAKKADASALGAYEEDHTPVSKCDPADQCGWQCDVPKGAGSQDKETKTVTTVGEFVRWCIEPSLQ